MPLPYFFYAPDDYEKWLPKFGFKISALKLAPKDTAYDGAAGLATWLNTTWLPFTQRVPENLRTSERCSLSPAEGERVRVRGEFNLRTSTK